ncbi:hypothetical protein KC19_2G140200 [Ceratodon purpureus]|uniref:Uncharacterized protein n=1 Tax=Ceratodon purpureus TaxID=3225 RepID=A0A8T0IVD8_CERPU|nr:hypothetical protein KC19_2G140200 [Ceratodon purpureus]
MQLSKEQDINIPELINLSHKQPAHIPTEHLLFTFLQAWVQATLRGAVAKLTWVLEMLRGIVARQTRKHKKKERRQTRKLKKERVGKHAAKKQAQCSLECPSFLWQGIG